MCSRRPPVSRGLEASVWAGKIASLRPGNIDRPQNLGFRFLHDIGDLERVEAALEELVSVNVDGHLRRLLILATDVPIDDAGYGVPTHAKLDGDLPVRQALASKTGDLSAILDCPKPIVVRRPDFQSSITRTVIGPLPAGRHGTGFGGRSEDRTAGRTGSMLQCVIHTAHHTRAPIHRAAQLRHITRQAHWLLVSG